MPFIVFDTIQWKCVTIELTLISRLKFQIIYNDQVFNLIWADKRSQWNSIKSNKWYKMNVSMFAYSKYTKITLTNIVTVVSVYI